VRVPAAAAPSEEGSAGIRACAPLLSEEGGFARAWGLASLGLRGGWGRRARRGNERGCGLVPASEEAGVGSRAGFARPPRRLGAARVGPCSASEEAGVGSSSGGLCSASEEAGVGSQLRCSWLRRRRSGSGAGGRRRSRWAAGSGRGSEELRLSPVFRWAGSSRGRGCALASC